MKRKILVLSLILTIILILGVAFNSSLTIRHYSIESKKVDSPIRIAFLADLHSCNYGDKSKYLSQKIKKASPDIVLLGGDIIDDVLPFDDTKIFLEKLAKDYACYYVLGNHEYWTGRVDEIKLFIKNCGITLLEGDAKTIKINSQVINICGIDDFEVGEKAFLEQLSQFYANDLKIFNLLLAHRPEYIEKYLGYNFDLILAGHAHGGQWRIPYILNGLYAPNQGWFPPYAGGLYIFNETSFIVSRGLAKESTNLPRIFNRPELVIVDIN